MTLSKAPKKETVATEMGLLFRSEKKTKESKQTFVPSDRAMCVLVTFVGKHRLRWPAEAEVPACQMLGRAVACMR